MRRRKKVSKINLTLTNQSDSLLEPSLQQTMLAALEAPRIWHQSQLSFHQRLTPDVELDLLKHGALVLIPPLGSREAFIKCIAANHQITEYYHHHPIQSLDEFIQLKRNRLGIRLVDHDETGRGFIVDSLKRGEVVTLCPDQQPRLRGGVFVDFFGHPGLTTLALPDILKQTGKPLILGCAIRREANFEVKLVNIEYTQQDDDDFILAKVNRALEVEIAANPDQYRWSDKRFNIQPQGMKKVYR